MIGRNVGTLLRFYARYAWRFVVLQQPEPLIYGIAITDHCNLSCRGCQVANTGRPNMTCFSSQIAGKSPHASCARRGRRALQLPSCGM